MLQVWTESCSFFGKFKEVAPRVKEIAQLSNEQVESFVRPLVQRTNEDGPDPNLIDDA